ncbi:MAG: hypothetical protein M1318_00240 [Firmicutes bacterium]|nr:hypothetical protein [Bacillota bacterium]
MQKGSEPKNTAATLELLVDGAAEAHRNLTEIWVIDVVEVGSFYSVSSVH